MLCYSNSLAHTCRDFEVRVSARAAGCLRELFCGEKIC